MKKEPLSCPCCGHEIEFEFVAEAVAEQHRVSVTISPDEKGRGLVDATTAAQTLATFAKLLKAVARETGVRVVPLLDGVGMDEKGAVTFRVLIARAGKNRGKENA